MGSEESLARHYAHGSLEQAILAALQASGKRLDRITPADLAPVDEFHLGGRQATAEFAAELPIEAGMQVLDVGSGLGGPSRYLAQERGCRVTGIDLTGEYVRAARTLARLVGLEERVAYVQGSALAMPFESGSFDAAWMLHVGMNVGDKPRLFAEARRVLRRGGFFGIFDVMGESRPEELAFPLPWASDPEASFVAGVETYREQLQSAGFSVERQRCRREFAIEFLRRARERTAGSEGGQPPLGIQIVMGPNAPLKLANLLRLMERGLLAPVELLARAG